METPRDREDAQSPDDGPIADGSGLFLFLRRWIVWVAGGLLVLALLRWVRF